MSSQTLEQILSLPVEERLRIADVIYESIASEGGPDIPDWLLRRCQERLAEYEANPEGTTVTWQKAKALALNAIGE